jgi:DNA-binding MarR family transcriptional regulator
MQVRSKKETSSILDRVIRREVPRENGLRAWEALLRAHATLLRQLALEIAEETGTTLGDFDVLAQLANAGGQLRMTELAEKVFSSRSGLTRRIDKLEAEGLINRTGAEADGRGVNVKLTEKGVERLKAIAPVHLRGVSKHFVEPLSDQELATLEGALNKVIVDCKFG